MLSSKQSEIKITLFNSSNEMDYVQEMIEKNLVEDFKHYFSFLFDEIQEKQDNGEEIVLQDFYDHHFESIQDFVSDIEWDEYKNLTSNISSFLKEKYGEKCTVLAIASLGLWNGRRTGYKLISNASITNIFANDCDSFAIYFEDDELKGEFHHHDGTNYVTYHLVKPSKLDSKDMNLLTEKLYNNHCDEEEIQSLINKCCYKNFGKSLKKALCF